jgi:methylated-DNA-protein-cysteine methyltransferase-like protein
MASSSSSFRLVYAVVSRVPLGRVATYGQIARLAGMPGHARLVGYALNALPEHSTVPWHRIVNAKGCISQRADSSGHEALQKRILQSEGVRFTRQAVIALGTYQWRPRRQSGAIP